MPVMEKSIAYPEEGFLVIGGWTRRQCGEAVLMGMAVGVFGGATSGNKCS
jgi:hypothetical protein